MKTFNMNLWAKICIGFFALGIIGNLLPENKSKTEVENTKNSVSEFKSTMTSLAQSRVNRSGFICRSVDESIVRGNHYVFLSCDGYMNTFKVRSEAGLVTVEAN